MANEHYKHGSVECIEAIKAALTEDEYRGFLKGNIIKYVWREGHKGSSLEDVQKAEDYTMMLVEETKQHLTA